MKITFPHLGSVYIAAKAFLEDLGNEVIVPPKCSKRTLEIGTKYSPETICLPLKINIGNYVESIEKGADTILITGSCGPCRFGYYSVIEREILKDLGYDVDIIVFDPPDGKPMELVKRIMKATNTKNLYKIGKSGYNANKILKEVDRLTDLANKTRARAENSFIVDRIMDDFHANIRNTYGSLKIMEIIKEAMLKIEKVKIKKQKKTLKIGIVGEIYTLIEPFVNLEIERKLGHLGVEVEKSLTLSKWFKHHISSGPFLPKEAKEVQKAAKPYLSTLVGGHGRETIGSTILYIQQGYDGIIQLLPLTCMPEIVAESILPNIQKDYDIPIMTLVVDEMTGEAGYLTRLEAFVDLLTRRREDNTIGSILLRS